MPLKIIDRNDEFMIQKVTAPNGELLRYQTVPLAMNDFSAVRQHDTLVEARERLGKGVITATEHLTKPKSEYPQCQKGYKAASGRHK